MIVSLSLNEDISTTLAKKMPKLPTSITRFAPNTYIIGYDGFDTSGCYFVGTEIIDGKEYKLEPVDLLADPSIIGEKEVFLLVVILGK